MKVKVDKSKVLKQNREFNHNSLDYFLAQNEVIVYGLKKTKNVSTYILLWNNGQHLIEVSTKFFIIIDNSISPAWKIRVDQNGDVYLFPELFFKDDFFDNFSEWEPNEREAFQKIKHLF